MTAQRAVKCEVARLVVPRTIAHVDLWSLNSEPANVPSLLAILLCDQVIIEQGTGKKILVGVFEEIRSPSEPIVQRVGFFARMTDLEGRYGFAIKVVRVAAEGEIVVAGGGIQMEQPIADRLLNVDIALNVPAIFPNFGMYEFQLFANDMYIGRAVLNCRKQEAANQ